MLGFSGWYYQHGTEEENIGDETLLSKCCEVNKIIHVQHGILFFKLPCKKKHFSD